MAGSGRARPNESRALASGFFVCGLAVAALGSVGARADEALPQALLGAYGTWDDASCSQSEAGDWRCSPPKAFSGLVVAPAGERLRVWMSFWSPTRGCEFDGVGAWNGKSLVAQQPIDAKPDEAACRVTVTFAGGKASTAGDPEACDCGGWITARDMPRITSDVAIPPMEPTRGRKSK